MNQASDTEREHQQARGQRDGARWRGENLGAEEIHAEQNQADKDACRADEHEERVLTSRSYYLDLTSKET